MHTLINTITRNLETTSFVVFSVLYIKAHQLFCRKKKIASWLLRIIYTLQFRPSLLAGRRACCPPRDPTTAPFAIHYPPEADPHRLLPRPHESLHTPRGKPCLLRSLPLHRTRAARDTRETVVEGIEVISENPTGCAAAGWFPGCVGR